MTIILTKDTHLGKKGSIINTTQPRGVYLVRMGVAKEHIQTSAKDKLKSKENGKSKPRATSKSKTKSKS